MAVETKTIAFDLVTFLDFKKMKFDCQKLPKNSVLKMSTCASLTMEKLCAILYSYVHDKVYKPRPNCFNDFQQRFVSRSPRNQSNYEP